MQELGDNTLRRVDWQNVFPVVLLPRACKYALGFQVLLLAFIGLVLTTIFASYLVPRDDSRPKQQRYLRQTRVIPPTGPNQAPFIGSQIVTVWALQSHEIMTYAENPEIWRENGMFFPGRLPAQGTLPLIYQPMAHPWAQLTGAGYSVFSLKTLEKLSWFVVVLIIWASFGGMMTRIVALRFAQDRRESFSQLFGFMRKKWLSYVGAMILPLIGIFFALLPVWLLNWIWQIMVEGMSLSSTAGWCVGFVHLILVFPFALVTVLMTIGFALGWPLMFAAISAEGSDAFDAVSRGFSYVYQRPIQFVFYHLCNLVIYTIGIIIAYVIFHKTITQIGNDYDPTSLMIIFNSFAFAYFWSSQTVIYFLLRRSCDATPYNQVFLGEIKKRTLPPFTFGKNGEPELKTET